MLLFFNTGVKNSCYKHLLKVHNTHSPERVIKISIQTKRVFEVETEFQPFLEFSTKNETNL